MNMFLANLSMSMPIVDITIEESVRRNPGNGRLFNSVDGTQLSLTQMRERIFSYSNCFSGTALIFFVRPPRQIVYHLQLGSRPECVN